MSVQAELRVIFHGRLIVIPAKAGIHASYWRWISAFAGMTIRLF
jgi:hypothetical protein